ncbi:T-complex protein 11-like protein 1 [Nematostella vectensis]|uniref:T-complex protein 11-like protein 1 n=1 Tax=Nematostella vectensis TaxID=45351 RepID=UPI00207731C6|nr:T-complex protein 11-like protein 1 [Nematostella vectensis]
MEGKQERTESQGITEKAEVEAAQIVGNMALAHELVMNDKFKLEGLPENSMEKQIRDIVHKAYWDKLQEDLDKTPPDYSQMLMLIADLKENLLGLLLPRHKSLKAQITEVLDVKHIKQQVEHGSLDLCQCAQFVVSVLSQMCAPVRDEQVKKLLEVDGIVNMFREIFGVIDVMKLDMANFQLQSLKPQLLQQSVEYERTKFKQYLESNPAGLQSTKVWLTQGSDKASVPTQTTAATSSGSGTGSVDRPDGNQTRIDILAHAYLGIIFGQPGWPYPETLIMDELRLAEFRAYAHFFTLVSSVILVTMGTVSKQLDKDAAYIARLKEVLFVLLEGLGEGDISSSMQNISDQVISETSKVLCERGLAQLTEEQKSAIQGQIAAVGNPEHVVRKLLKDRAYQFFFKSLTTRLRRGLTQGQSVPVPPGLDPVKTELTELVSGFARLVSHNASVYRPFYEDILDGLQAQPAHVQ